MALTISLNAKAITAANLNRTQLITGAATQQNYLRTGYNIVDTCLRSITFSNDDKNVSTLMLRGNELGLSRSIAPLKNLTLLEKLQTIDISNNGLSQVQVSNIVNQLYQSALINSLRAVNYNIGGNNAIPDVKALIQLDELQNNYGFTDDGNISVFVTDNSVDASKSFVFDGTAGDITVDWGDGVTDTITLGSGAVTVNHTYAGTATITGYIRGALASITSFTGSGCELDSIDVSLFVNLEYLDLDGNNLTLLDVNANTLLTDLIVSNNQLTAGTITVGNNVLLKNLDINTNSIDAFIISDNPALISFIANDNALAYLDTTTNILLESVNLSNNQIANTTVFTTNPLLTSLNLSGCAITDQSVIDFILTDAAAAGLAIAIDVSGGTNATPSTADGVPPISTIVANGGSVTHN